MLHYAYIIKIKTNVPDILNRIKNQKYFTLTESVSFNFSNKEIFLISFDNQFINYISLVERQGLIATATCRLKFTNLINLENELSFEELEKLQFKNEENIHIQIISPELLSAIITLIKEKKSSKKNEIDWLINRRDFTFLSGLSSIDVQERDAINLSLKMSNMNLLKTEFNTDIDNANEKLITPHFLQLNKKIILEDRMIDYDSSKFNGLIGKEYTNKTVFTDGNKVLTVLNVNRDKIEEITGVDLIYFNHNFNSYIMVQYKRMLKEMRGRFVYRLNDKSYEKELIAMKKLHSIIQNFENKTSEIDDYRINTNPFYFKLCQAEVENLSEMEMIKGMYIPLDYWNLLLNSNVTTGEKGGKLFTTENVKRYFNNSEFCELVQNSWIGTNQSQSNFLSDLFEYCMTEKKSVIIAKLEHLKLELNKTNI